MCADWIITLNGRCALCRAREVSLTHFYARVSCESRRFVCVITRASARRRIARARARNTRFNLYSSIVVVVVAEALA